MIQHAVDPVADVDLSFERLKVDVAGSPFDGSVENRVHQPDEGRLIRSVE